LEFPSVNINFLRLLTDNTGILQHSKFCIPNRKEGYTTDDNARALIVASRSYMASKDVEMQRLANLYLSFLLYMQRNDGRLHNFLGYDRKILDQVGSEECMGQTLWACGTCVNTSLNLDETLLAKEIFDKTFRWAFGFKSLRAKAFSIIGLQQYSEAYPEDKNPVLNVKVLADYLIDWYDTASSSEWKWFEPYVTYANARLPQALLAAYVMTGNQKYYQVGVDSLEFLLKVQLVENKFIPVGNKGWYLKGGERTFYDQQPVEVSCTIDAISEAFRITGDERYRGLAQTVFEWFLGNNSKNLMVYDSETGGCYDGITLQGLNLNQGAESTLSYLLARLKMEDLKKSPKSIQ
jgi:hypothetical protein